MGRMIPKHAVSVKMPAALWKEMMVIADGRGVTLTSLILHACYFYLPQLLKEEKAREEAMGEGRQTE
jgi:hypothetical protein